MKYNRIFCWVTEEDKEGFSKIKAPIEFVNNSEDFKKGLKEGDLLGISLELANTNFYDIIEILESNTDKYFCIFTYDSSKKFATDEMIDFLFLKNIKTYGEGHVLYGLPQIEFEWFN